MPQSFFHLSSPVEVQIMVNPNATIFLGPLWGHSKIINTSKIISVSNPLVFFGGYLFFYKSEEDEIQNLLKLKECRNNILFNLSRFEDYFLTIAGINEEKNYQFKRWINPLSGILSAVEYYGITSDEIFAAPENIFSNLQSAIKLKNDEDFYGSLQSDLLPTKVLMEIEKSIGNKEAFSYLSLYDSDGVCLEKLPFSEKLIENYVTKCHDSIQRFESRGILV